MCDIFKSIRPTGVKLGEYVQRTNPTNICYGDLCIAIRKGCQTPDFLSYPELNVAVFKLTFPY